MDTTGMLRSRRFFRVRWFAAARVFAAGILALGSLNAQPPSDEATSWKKGDFVLGRWDGARTALDDYGIDPFVYWTGIGSGNPLGGASQGHITVVDDFYMGLKLNLGKFTRWRGASITISGVNRDGRGLTNQYVKSQYNSQQTVGGQNLFFYQLFFKQQLLDGKVSFKVGRFAASDDLNESPIYGYYLNNGINGDIRNVLFDTQSSAYPFATWAGLLQFNPNTRLNFQFGVYQTWQNIFNSNTNGLDWSIHSGDGVIYMAQAGWTPALFGKPVNSVGATPASNGLPGHYWFGTTYSPWKGFTQFESTAKAANSYGFYAHADQMVYQRYPGGTEGLTVWAAAGYYPQQNIAIVPFQLNAGAFYKGLFPRRRADRTILGVIYGQFSRDYAHTLLAGGKGDPSHELVLEVAYRFRLLKFLFFQPDLQGDVRPAGTGKIPNAIVTGAEMGLVF